MIHTLWWVINDINKFDLMDFIQSVFEFAHGMPNIFLSCSCNVFCMCAPLTILAESYAQMFVIFNNFMGVLSKIN